MAIHLITLTPIQISVLTKLDDGLNHLDSVGREIEDLDIRQIMICAELLRLGLVEAQFGWRGSFWFRLTPNGRLVREGRAA